MQACLGNKLKIEQAGNGVGKAGFLLRCVQLERQTMIHDCFENASEKEVEACSHQMSQNPLWAAFVLDVAQQQGYAHAYEKSHKLHTNPPQSTMGTKTHILAPRSQVPQAASRAIKTRIMKSIGSG